MLNPQEPQKKGFRAYAERDKERRLADEIDNVVVTNAARTPSVEEDLTPMAVVPDSEPGPAQK